MPTQTCLLVSHNSRIQCLLDIFQPSSEKLRFQNCAIMKLCLGTEHISLELVYSGEITEDEKRNLTRKYYSTDANPSDEEYEAQKYRKYNSVEVTDPVSIHQIIRKLKLHPHDLTNNHVIYIVRHGQSEHNVSDNAASIFHMTLDTSIVSSGTEAAKNAGEFIKRTGISASIQRIYVSDLKRTVQTVRAITKIIEKSGIEPIVLPCASEVVESGENGNCDSASSELYAIQKMARENYPSCTVSDIKAGRDPCNHLNWNLYLNFYGNKMRGENDTVWGRTFGHPVTKQHCKDTTVIAMALYEMVYFNDPGNTLSLELFISQRVLGGGKRKTKKLSRILPVFHKRIQHKKRKYSQKNIKN